jgi:hypothetical protein
MGAPFTGHVENITVEVSDWHISPVDTGQIQRNSNSK